MYRKSEHFFKNHIKTLYLQLTEFHHARFIWALRSMFAAIFSLVIAYFFHDAALWLISSSVFALQFYAYTGSVISKNKIVQWSILLVFISVFISLLSYMLWGLWLIVVMTIFLAFYLSHRSNEHAIVGMWSAALIIINASFPITMSEAVLRAVWLFIGVMIAYLMAGRKKTEMISLPSMNRGLTGEKKAYLKYGIKGALTALLALIVSSLFHISHSYWVLFGSTTVLKLQVEASLRRGGERIYGTLVGVGISLLLALCLLHWPLGIIIVIPICIFGAVYYFFYYVIAMIFVTILFVLTFGVISQQPIEYGLARIADTALGVILALLVSASLWPYKEKHRR